jgi:hypothetical protein
MSDIRFELLPGLPATGPLPSFFSPRKEPRYSEGLVVRFHTALGTWVANFERLSSSYLDGAFANPDGAGVIVVAGGQAYDIDPNARTVRHIFDSLVQFVLSCQNPQSLIFSDGVSLSALGAVGVLWRTRRLSWDEIRCLRLEGDKILGEASDLSDEWIPFEVDLRSGAATGGIDFAGTLTS